jgi:exopolysaccharide biosynthesis polyprenyl glycosylphosphotransferase
MLIIIYTFLVAELFQSRFILLTAYGLALLFVTLARNIVRRVQQMLLERGFGIHRVVLAGDGRYADLLEQLFDNNPRMGYQVVGTPEIIRWDILEEIYSEHGIDDVIQTDASLTEDDNLVLLDFCDKYKIDYKYVPNLFETYAARVRFREMGGVPLMELQRTPLDGWGRIAKRVMDMIGVVVGLILLGPIMLITALAIKLESAGPVFYSQKRVGRNKKEFQVFKFRSMRIEYCTGNKFGGKKADEFEKNLRDKTNERKGPLFKMKNDPRITRVGKFIRRWRIDELPQFFNVWRGEMSLLGPRPHLPQEVAQYEKYHQKLFTIKPGMSGMAQVQGNAGLSFEDEARLDIAYVEGWSLKLDILLLLKTFAILVTDKNAV